MRRLFQRVNAWSLLAPAVFIAMALQTTVANLPAERIFAGHDTGFYTYSPDQLLRLASGTWQVKENYGYPNYTGLVALPFALLIKVIWLFPVTAEMVGRAFYFFEIVLGQAGAYWLAKLCVRRCFPEAPQSHVELAAIGASVVSVYNIFSAMLLLYPASPFQYSLFLWPFTIALQLYVLWYSRSILWAIPLSVLLVISTMGSPSHTILGVLLSVAIYIVNGLTSRSWRLSLLASTGVMTILGTAYFWLPLVGASLLYHGPVVVREGLAESDLIKGQAILSARSGIESLLRFDGLNWFPKLVSSSFYLQNYMVGLCYVPAFVASIALFTRKRLVIALWALLIIGIEFAKGVHPPFALPMVTLLTHVKGFAAYRVPYDKFILLVVLSLPPLFAIGTTYLLQKRRWVAYACLAAVLVTSWPFLGGQVASPYYLVKIPRDYSAVNALIGDDPETRVLSFPGAYIDLNVTRWFKGENFEQLLFRSRIVNANTFRQRALSSAPLYNDNELRGARDLSTIVGLAKPYNIDYILVHRDYLTEYLLAFDHQAYKVNGPLQARAAEDILNVDRRVSKVYEGPDLVLYRMAPEATAAHIYSAGRATYATGFQNATFALADTTTMPVWPAVLFGGNQYAPTTRQEDELYRSFRLASATVRTPIVPESKALYQEQIVQNDRSVEQLAAAETRYPVPSAVVFQQPHSDYFHDRAPGVENIRGLWSAERSAPRRVVMSYEAERVSTPLLTEYFGSEGTSPPKPLSMDSMPQAFQVYTSGQEIPRPETDRYAQVPISIIETPASAVYQQRFGLRADAPELSVIRPTLKPVPLGDDPQVSLRYVLSNGALQRSWIRFALRDRLGALVYFDRALDPSGVLQSYDVRDGLQAALDEKYDRLLRANERDVALRLGKGQFNPEQAEDFSLEGLFIVFGKAAGESFEGSTQTFSFKMRSLQIERAGLARPSYPVSAASTPALSPSIRTRSENLGSAHVRRELGSLIVTATLAQQLEQTTADLVGSVVTFALKAGGTERDLVLSETPTAYLVRKPDAAERKLLFKDAVTAVTEKGRSSIGSFDFIIPLPKIDILRSPEMRIRYWLGSGGETATVTLGVRGSHGIEEFVPGREIDPNAARQSTPPEWISKTSIPGQGAYLTASNSVAPAVPSDSGWREMTFDVREAMAYRADRLNAPLVFARVHVECVGSVENRATQEYAMGLGNVDFYGRTTIAPQAPEPLIAVDRIARKANSIRPISAFGESIASYDLGPSSAGPHRLSTLLSRPFRVRSVGVVDRDYPLEGGGPMKFRRVADALYTIDAERLQNSWVVFSESFNPGWRLIPVDTPPSGRIAWALSLRWLHPSVEPHIVANGFANTWRLPARGRYYVLDFAPQDIFVFAVAFSLVGFLLGVMTLLASTWIRKRRLSGGASA